MMMPMVMVVVIPVVVMVAVIVMVPVIVLALPVARGIVRVDVHARAMVVMTGRGDPPGVAPQEKREAKACDGQPRDHAEPRTRRSARHTETHRA
jgi:hypothetical protein